jgi:hypothetical protein
MSELVVRVARAMRALVLPAGTHLDQDWKSIGDGARRMYCRDAKTAIEAMREPTQAMLRKADAVFDDRSYDRSDELREAWQAMIDAALTPSLTSNKGNTE